MNVITAVLSRKTKYRPEPLQTLDAALKSIEESLLCTQTNKRRVVTTLDEHKGDLSSVINDPVMCHAIEKHYGQPSLWKLNVLLLAQIYKQQFDHLLSASLDTIDDFSIISGLAKSNIGLELFLTQSGMPTSRPLERRLAEIYWASRRNADVTERLYDELLARIDDTMLLSGACSPEKTAYSDWCSRLYAEYEESFWRVLTEDSATQLRHTTKQLLRMEEVALETALICGGGRKTILLTQASAGADERAFAILGELVLFAHSRRSGWQNDLAHWQRIEILLKDYLRNAFGNRVTALDMSHLQALIAAREFISDYLS